MLWQKSRRAEEFLKRDNSKKRAPDRARARCIVIRGACPHMAMRVHPPARGQNLRTQETSRYEVESTDVQPSIPTHTTGIELKRPRGLARVPSAVRLTGSPRPGFRLREILIEIRPPGSELL